MQDVLTDSVFARARTVMIPVDALPLKSGVTCPVSEEMGIRIGNVVIPVLAVSLLQQRLLLKMANP